MRTKWSFKIRSFYDKPNIFEHSFKISNDKNTYQESTYMICNTFELLPMMFKCFSINCFRSHISFSIISRIWIWIPKSVHDQFSCKNLSCGGGSVQLTFVQRTGLYLIMHCWPWHKLIRWKIADHLYDLK